MSAAVATPEVVAAGPARAPRFARRLLRRPLAAGCLAFLGLVVLVAIFAPILMPHVAQENAGDLLAAGQGPSADHLLGTDQLGRDVLDRLLVGTRVTLVGVAEALAVVLVLGVPLGLASGYLGGRLDRVVGWLADLTFSMPAVVILLVVLAIFPQSMTAGMVAFGLIAAPDLMRVVRSATLPVREELYIAAASVAGLSRPYIIARHVLPRISGAVIVQASLLAASALLVQTGLAFLDLLVAAPAPSWGGMVADGVEALETQPWLIWPPGLMITATVLTLGLLGDAVRDATTEGWAAAATTRRRHSHRRTTPAAVAVPANAAAGTEPEPDALLSVEGLTIAAASSHGPITLVEGVSFSVQPGETVAVVGESGCGKTITAMSILGLLPAGTWIEHGRIAFGSRDLQALGERELERIRGREIGLISQEPMISLNPAFRVGSQLAEVVRLHHHVSRSAAREHAVELLRQVHLSEPEDVARRYPHELSGGMAQRVAIARALAGEPKLLIADEPTTALDVTVQAEILDLLRELQRERGMAVLLVTHDWGVVADLSDRAIVMYAGQVVEAAPLGPIFREPLHPYTEGLLASNPHNAPEADVLPMIPGSVPAPGGWPTGCHFHPRCRYRTPACTERPIPLEHPALARETRCIHHDQLG